MLGDKVGVLTGRVTGQRVLPVADGPKVETSFEISGEFGGVASTFMGTYWAIVRPDGSLYGECPGQGVFMTADGGMGTWTAAGVGRFTGEGSGVSFRGAIYLLTAPASLAELSHSAIIYEWDVDGDGAATGAFWDWH
jgi:hypothetical protein